MALPAPCPCGTGLALADCCGPYHAGLAAPTAEALMRSRYSAFVLRHADYLRATWHPSTRPADLLLSATTRWLGLDLRRHTVTGPARAEVEFVARSREGGGAAQRLHERSQFVLEDGRWWYVDGAFDPPRDKPRS